MLTIELKRVFRRPVFLFLIFAGLIIALIPAVNTWPHMVTDDYYIFYPRSAYVSWMYFIGSTYYIYSLIFPLLSSLAYADSYAEDINTGLIKNILTKVEKKRYLVTRYFVNFLIGGFIGVFPLVVNFFAEMTAFPLIENNFYFGMNLISMISFWPALFYSHPMLYVLVRLAIVFLFGGTLASVGLAFSTLNQNRYITLVFPFLVVLIIDVLTSAIGFPSISLLFLGSIASTWEIPVYLLVGMIGSFLWYYIAGDKIETY